MLSGLSEKPLVSILTPCRNSAKFIECCIQSVLSQDYPYVEPIIQDGASTDETVDILRRYEGCVDWISEKDNGQSDGLNRALGRCRGEIIGVLNSDDEYLSHAARWAVENMRKYPKAAVIYGQQYLIDSHGRRLPWNAADAMPYDFKKIFCCEDVIPAQAAFIRRTALEAVGFYVDVSRRTCPDFEMWVRIGLKFPMRYVPGHVANYRIHPGSESQQDDLVDEFVKSKTEVVKKVCDDPNTPEKIRVWKRYARSKILIWSSNHLMPPMKTGKYHRAVVQVAKAFWMWPSLRTFKFLLTLLFFSLASVFPALTFIEKVNVSKIRETGRKIDHRLLGGLVYRFLYLPLKNLHSK